MDPQTLNPSPAASARRRWKSLLIAVILISAWVLVIVFRMELRSYYWAQRLAHATGDAERKPYLVRLAAVEDHALGAIAGLLDDSSAEVRGDAIYLLGRLHTLGSDELLLDALGDASESNAWQAAVHLSRRMDREDVQSELEARFSATSGRVWEYTAITLGLSSRPDSIASLIRETEEADDPDRLAVLIDALRLSRDARATPVLNHLLDDERPVSITPPSERHILKALTSLGPELLQKGIDVRTLATATAPQRTVSDMARRALEMIENPPE
jgi:hypothetical protein